MKFEVTHPKIWKKLAETNMPMKNKIKVYEKMGGAYRLGKDGGEQVFNKMTELLKHRVTSPLLFGIRTANNGFSSQSEEMKTAFSIMQTMTIQLSNVNPRT